MPVFTTNYNPLLHGAYAIEVPPPSALIPTSTGVAAMVGQFDWGPVQSLYIPSGQQDIYNTYAPAGMNRASSGFLCVQRKAFPLLMINRILGVGYATAFVNLLSGSSTMGSVTHVSGTGPSVSLSGTPNASVASILLTVTAGGSGTTAVFSLTVNGGTPITGLVASTATVLTGTGLTADFGTGTYTTADSYSAINTAVILTVNAKYPGIAGNNLTATVAAPTDGVTGHFNLTVSVTGASGTTNDQFSNINLTGTGANFVPSTTNAILTGSLVAGTTAVGGATLGTFSLASGSNGAAIGQSDYVGTQGTANLGIALFETSLLIRHCFSDYPGSSTIQSEVNAGLMNHCTYMGDRVCYINGPMGQSVTLVQTDVSNYRSDRVVYCDPWVYINDEITGNMELVMSAPFAASVASQLPTSTSIGWKNPEVTQAMLGAGIVGVEFLRGQAAGVNTLNGVATFQPEQLGGFSIEAGVVTEAAVDPTRARLTRRRVGDLVATTFVEQTRSFIDSPNLPWNQNNIIQALDALLDQLKQAQNFDPNHNDHIINYGIQNLNTVNSPESLASGLFIIPLQVQTSSGIEKLFLAIQFGETVTVSAQ